MGTEVHVEAAQQNIEGLLIVQQSDMLCINAVQSTAKMYLMLSRMPVVSIMSSPIKSSYACGSERQGSVASCLGLFADK